MAITELLTAVTSGLGGGIVGGVLGLGKKFLADKHESKILAIQTTERAKDREHDLALAEKEIERDMKAAESTLQQAMFESDCKALTTASTSQDAEISVFGDVLDGCWPWVKSLISIMFAFVTVCQKMVRIVLTIALVWQTFKIFGEVNANLGGIDAIEYTDAAEIFKKIIYSILNLTGIAVGFWFVSRPEKPNRS